MHIIPLNGHTITCLISLYWCSFKVLTIFHSDTVNILCSRVCIYIYTRTIFFAYSLIAVLQRGVYSLSCESSGRALCYHPSRSWDLSPVSNEWGIVFSTLHKVNSPCNLIRPTMWFFMIIFHFHRLFLNVL